MLIYIKKFKIFRLNYIKNEDLATHNQIRALIFPAFQYPIVNGKKVKKSIFSNNKIILEYL